MRTPIEALKEIRDRLTYFCLRTDGKYDPPWATELVGITDEALTESRAIGNAAAMREALKELNKLFDSGVLGTHYDMTAEEMEKVDELYFKTKAALSAPARNCDRFTSIEEARTAYCSECGRLISIWDEDVSWLFEEWLLAPAAERKGEGDGR